MVAYVLYIMLRANSRYFHKQHRVFFVMEMDLLLYEAGTELLYNIYTNFMLLSRSGQQEPEAQHRCDE
jgi:hypothetical protein